MAEVEISSVKAVEEFKKLIAKTENLVGKLKVLDSRLKTVDRSMGLVGKQAQIVVRSQAAASKAVEAETKARIRQTAATRRQTEAAKRQTAALGTRKMRALGSQMQLMMRSQVAATVTTVGMSTSLRNLGSSAIFAVGPLSGVGARLTAFSAIAGRTKLSTALLAVSFVALGVAIIKSFKEIITAGRDLQKTLIILKVATGSLASAKDAFKFLREESSRLGVSLKASTTQFAQMSAAAKGTRLTTADLRKGFTAISSAAAVLQLTTEQTTGAFRAIQQMMSKGTVQSEELRGQLGERLPGAFQIAARSIGVTTEKLGEMLEKGEVIADEFLPRFFDELLKTFGTGIEAAAGTATAEVNKLGNAMFEIGVELDRLTGASEIFTSFLKAAREAAEGIASALSFDPREALVANLEAAQRRLALSRGEEVPSRPALFESALPVGAAGRFNPKRAGVSGPGAVGAQGRGVGRGADRLSLEEKNVASVKKFTQALLDLDVVVTENLLRITLREAGLRNQLDTEKKLPKSIKSIVVELKQFQATLKALEAGGDLEAAAKIKDLAAAEKLLIRIPLKEQGALRRALDDLEFSGKNAAEQIRQLILKTRTAEEASEKLSDKLKEEIKNKEKLLKLEAAFEDKVLIAIQTLAIAKDETKETEEKIRLIAIESTLRKELFKRRKVGAELTKQEINDLRLLSTVLVDAKQKEKDLKDELSEVNKLAKDFSKVIGTAFEDAIVKGEGFRAVLKGIIDDINKIVLRVGVTKPLGDLLEKEVGKLGLGEGFLGNLFKEADDTADSLKALAEASSESSGVLSQNLVDAAIQAAVSTGTQTAAVGASTSAITLMAVSAEAAAVALNAVAAAGGGGGGGIGGIIGGLFGGGSSFGGGGALGSFGSIGTTGAGVNSGALLGGGLSGSFFAHGGRPPVGRLAIVGERGPEAFVPDRPGTILPNSALKTFGGGDTFITIDARGADKAAIARLERELFSLKATFNRRAVGAVSERSRRGR